LKYLLRFVEAWAVPDFHVGQKILVKRHLLEIYIVISLVFTIAASSFFLIFINMVVSQDDNIVLLLMTIVILALLVFWPAYIIILIFKKASQRNKNLTYFSILLLVISISSWIEMILLKTFGDILFCIISTFLPLSYIAAIIKCKKLNVSE